MVENSKASTVEILGRDFFGYQKSKLKRTPVQKKYTSANFVLEFPFHRRVPIARHMIDAAAAMAVVSLLHHHHRSPQRVVTCTACVMCRLLKPCHPIVRARAAIMEAKLTVNLQFMSSTSHIALLLVDSIDRPFPFWSLSLATSCAILHILRID